MALSIDPKFKKWFESRKIAQRTGTGIPTRNANPTREAGPKNSTTPKVQPKTEKTGVPKTVTKKSVGRQKGKVRATNHPQHKTRG